MKAPYEETLSPLDDARAESLVRRHRLASQRSEQVPACVLISLAQQGIQEIQQNISSLRHGRSSAQAA